LALDECDLTDGDVGAASVTHVLRVHDEPDHLRASEIDLDGLLRDIVVKQDDAALLAVVGTQLDLPWAA
jgi:hypothetical protein